MKDGSNRLKGRRTLAFAADRMPRQCPNCSKPLKASVESFLLLGRKGEKAMASGEGHFCLGCDVVVLDADHFKEMARFGLPDVRLFTVAGFVDLDSVPESKRYSPFDSNDNPIPFVEFASFEWRDGKS